MHIWGGDGAKAGDVVEVSNYDGSTVMMEVSPGYALISAEIFSRGDSNGFCENYTLESNGATSFQSNNLMTDSDLLPNDPSRTGVPNVSDLENISLELVRPVL